MRKIKRSSSIESLKWAWGYGRSPEVAPIGLGTAHELPGNGPRLPRSRGRWDQSGDDDRLEGGVVRRAAAQPSDGAADARLSPIFIGSGSNILHVTQQLAVGGVPAGNCPDSAIVTAAAFASCISGGGGNRTLCAAAGATRPVRKLFVDWAGTKIPDS